MKTTQVLFDYHNESFVTPPAQVSLLTFCLRTLVNHWHRFRYTDDKIFGGDVSDAFNFECLDNSVTKIPVIEHQCC